MKKPLLVAICFIYGSLSFAQCPMPYVTKTFKGVEYYTASKGQLKLLKKTYSNNTLEIIKNTSNTEGDIFAITGSLLGKYVQFIKEYECTYEEKFTNYKFHTSDGKTNNTWVLTILKNGAIFKVVAIMAEDNLLIELVN